MFVVQVPSGLRAAVTGGVPKAGVGQRRLQHGQESRVADRGRRRHPIRRHRRAVGRARVDRGERGLAAANVGAVPCSPGPHGVAVFNIGRNNCELCHIRRCQRDVQCTAYFCNALDFAGRGILFCPYNCETASIRKQSSLLKNFDLHLAGSTGGRQE